MGTPLTGTTPQDTYDSLIKVTDNGPLTTSLKVLTDGLGNDSTLSLSQTAASIAGTLAVAGAATFDTSTLVVDAANNRVGIGTATPASILQLEKSSDSGSASIFPSLQVKNTLATQGDGSSTFNFSNLNLSSGDGAVNMFLLTTFAAGTWEPSAQLSVSSNHPLVFKTNNTERMRILADGNVGIGTKCPAAKLDVSGGNIHSFYTYSGDGSNYNLRVGNDLDASQFGYFSQLGGSTFVANNNYYASAGQFKPTATAASSISLSEGNIVFFGNTGLTAGTNYAPTERARFTANGLTFNGDTAAANALDDYEEGTWTMGVSFGGASVGVTYLDNTGTYTKIGRKVTVNGYISLTSKGSSTGQARISGLPFTIGSTSGFFSTASMWFFNVSFANQFQAYGELNSTQIILSELTEAGAYTVLNDSNFADNTELMMSLTYFV
jgi:hypothetical protein